MPLFALMCLDKPGHGAVRQDNRPAHRAHVADSGAVLQGGPLLDDDGAMIGSLLILDVPDRAAAEAWAEADPYARAGLFQSVTLHRWDKVFG